MAVRRATIADLLLLRTMWQEMYDEKPPPYPFYAPSELTALTEQLALTLVKTDEQTFFRAFVLEVDGEPAGFCAGELKARGFGIPRMYGAAHWLFVRPEYRGLGHGRALAKACIEYLASLGLEMIEVVSMLGDEQWMRRGFVPVSVNQVARADAVLATIAKKDAEAGNGHDLEPLQPEVSDAPPE